MQIRVLISDTNLKDITHDEVIFVSDTNVELTSNNNLKSDFSIKAHQKYLLHVSNGTICLNDYHGGEDKSCLLHNQILIKSHATNIISILNINRLFQGHNVVLQLKGGIEIKVINNQLRIIQIIDIEDYVLGVLAAEMPSSFHLEAMKAQAIALRTYALNPRINHQIQEANVCDSYFCCQYYCGQVEVLSNYRQAVNQTSGNIITYEGSPILALFSSCAGGITQRYEDCFSDLKTKQFPGKPLPYLMSVSEGSLGQEYYKLVGQGTLSYLYRANYIDTVDFQFPQFKWKLELDKNALESHLHFNVHQLLSENDNTPFITPPKSNVFGHIKSFSVSKYGVGGVAMELIVCTSTGNWIVKKELLIRKLFQNTVARLKLLKSARIFFRHNYDSLGLLSKLTIYGLGLGHGVGLQQIGAQGHAQAGKSGEQIVSHYYLNAQITHI